MINDDEDFFVFINYRREDSSSEAMMIAKSLTEALDNNNNKRKRVFVDTEMIDLGDVWPKRIIHALASCQYVLVLIGVDWLTAGIDKWGRRRIDNETDWVRKEISYALNNNSITENHEIDDNNKPSSNGIKERKPNKKTVIPILLNGAEMPPQEVLPKDIASITTRQAFALRTDDDNHWKEDLAVLFNRIVPFEYDDKSMKNNPLLKPIWNRMDNELQKALTLAASLADKEGKNYVSTTTFVKALDILRPGKISDFFEQLPEGAIPPKEEAEKNDHDINDVNAIKKLGSFSPCINSAISHLTPKLDNDVADSASEGEAKPNAVLSSEDVFIDIARYAKGKSTKCLRAHGVSKSDVEKIVRQLGWELVERDE